MPFEVPQVVYEVFGQESIQDDAVMLIEIDDSTLDAPERYCSHGIERLTGEDTMGLTVGEDFYEHLLFDAVFPSQRQNEQPKAQLNIYNVDRATVDLLTNMTIDATANMSIVLASDPSVAVRTFLPFRVLRRSKNKEALVLDLSMRANGFDGGDDLEMIPSRVQSYVEAPGLHR